MEPYQYEFEDLKIAYEDFEQPKIMAFVNDKDITKEGLAIIGLNMNLSSGYEASLVSMEIGEVFDQQESKYKIDDIKKLVTLGSKIEIFLGYGVTFRSVFRGFISQIGFLYSSRGIPTMEVTAMDIKGVMMNGQYNKQLASKDYFAAVKEIFQKTSITTVTGDASQPFIKLADIKAPESTSSNDSGEEEVTAFSVEMVNETDYEFVVRAAKRFNYEFFCVGDQIIFRKAKSNPGMLMKINPRFLISDFHVEYNISGLTSKIEVRGVDPGKGTVIVGSKDIKNTISTGKNASQILKDSIFVLQDPTVSSDEDVNNRIAYLENDISNRFCRLSIEMIGIPEVIPGVFFELEKLTSDLSKEFYITNVYHSFQDGEGFKTRIEATAPTLDSWSTREAGDGASV